MKEDNMENTVEKIETEGFYAREYGLNVDVPKGMNDNDFKDYTYNLNRGMSKEERLNYFKKPIPWEEGQLIAQRSKDNPEEKSLLNEAWEGTKNVFKTGWNQSVDLATSFGESYDVGVSSLVLSAMPDQEKAKSVLIRQIDDYNKLKEKVKADTSTAGEISSGLGSVGLSTFAGAATYGHPVLNSAFLLSFGLSNYLDNLETMLKQGASIKEANTRALTGGLLEVASEKAGLKIAGKYTNTLLKKYGARFGIEGIQELWQDTKDEVVLGKYDTRTEEQKAKSSFYALMFGGLGGAIGFAINDISTRPERAKIENRAKESGYTNTESKEIGLSILEEDGGALRKEIQEKARERAKATIEETRSALYDKFIEKGDSAEIAAEKVQTLVPDYDLLKKDVEDLVREGFSENELEKFKADYDEAVSVGGDEAESYIKAKDELKQKLVNAGVEDEKADKEARMFTGIVVNGYQAYKDTERALGREPTKGFDEVKEEFYKLNSVINHSIDDTNEMWAEYDARNQTDFNEEQDMVEGKPSRKLFSKTEEELKLEETQQRAFTKDVQTVIKEAKRDKPSNKVKAGFGKVSKWLDVVSSRVGLNISGYKHVVDAQGVRHIYNRHGEGNEAEANQIPVTDKDIEIIPTIVNSPNFLVYGTKTDKGLDGIGYLKTMTDGTTYYVEEVRDEDEQLAAKTLYKIEGVTAESLVKESRRPTSETAPSAVRLVEKLKSATVVPAFTKSLSSGNLNVKRVDENGKLYSKTIDNTMNDKAKEFFGTTHNLKEAGYILENGELLDFSGKKQGASGGYRTIDHQDIKDAFDVQDDGEAESLVAFVNNGNIRFMPETNGFYMSNMPTPEQMKVIKRVFEKDFGEGEVELYHDASDWGNRDKVFYRQYERGTDFKTIERDIIAFFNGNTSKANQYLSQTQGEVLGSYDPVAREVELFKGQNPSTLTHELGHHFLLSHLRLMESMGLKDRNAPVFEWLSKVVGRDINSVADMEEIEGDVINPHEALVEAFISYMNNGEAPNLVTENIFKRAKNWLLDRFRVHKTEASTEIRDYFDSIIARDETIPDMSGLTTRTREIAEILKQAKKGEQVSFKGLGKKELKELQKAFHSIVRRKGRSLRDMIIERGGIKEGTELAKSLGFDVLKKDKMYTTKDTAFDNEAELIDWLAEEGLIVGVQEGEDYSATERRWEDVQRLIDNAENTYTVRESLINQERETALANRAYVQEIVDELLKDNDLGLKDINDLDDLLSKIVSRKDDVDITKVNSNAIKYLNERVKGLNKEIKALERNKNKEFKNKREEQYLAQNDLKDFIRGLPINNQHKVALMGNIQRVKGYDTLPSILEDIKPRIREYIEQEAKFLLSKNIDTLIKRSKPKKVTKQFSTYTYNKLFEELRDIYKLSQKQAQHQVMGIKLEQEEDFDNSLAGRLKRSLLFYKAEGMGSSLIAMKTLYDNLNTIYNEAVNAGIDAQIQKGEARTEAINEVIDYVKTHEPAKNFISRMFNKDKKSDDVYVKNTDFYGLSSALFGKKWADEHQMLTVLNDVLEKVANRQDNAYAVARKIYGAKSQAELMNILAEKNKVIDSITANDGSFYELSISDIMDIYNGMKNDKTKRLFIENYEEIDEEGNQTTHNIDNLFKNLSDEDKAYADFMQKDLEQNYDELNKLYVKLYGIDMKKEENYWARTSEKPDPFYDLKDAKGFSPLSTIASQMKERATTVKPVPSNAIAKYNKGVSDYYYMTTAFEKFKDIYDVVTSKYVKVAIQGKYDSNVYEALADHLRAMSLSGNQIHLSDIDNKANQVVANIVGSKIALNVNVFFKQLISITNYSENMPVVEFSKNLVEGIMHPKETIKYMNDIAGSFLSTRMKGGLQSEAVARFIKESQSLNSKWFKAGTKYNWTEFMGTLVKYGDIIPIYFGGYARVKYLMDNGATKQEALDKFKFETLQTQQAANAAALAGYQRSKNPAARLFSAFLNAPAQYMRKIYNADIQYRRGEITHEQFIKTTMNYGVVQPAIYIMLSNILRGLWNDDDDTPFYEGLVSYLVTSPFQGIPLAGSILQNVGTAIEKRIADKYVANDVVGVLFVDDINRAWRKANKKDIEFLDWFDIITPIIEPLVQAPITSVKQVARAIDSRL